jgi:serine protease Do
MPNSGYKRQRHGLNQGPSGWSWRTSRKAIVMMALTVLVVPMHLVWAQASSRFWSEQPSQSLHLPMLKQLNAELNKLTDALLPGIVSLRVLTDTNNGNLPKDHPPTPENTQPYGTGSGFIIRSDGLLLTNYHVIEKGTNIEVHFYNGRVSTATILGEDPIGDLALLQVKTERPLPIVPLGSSATVEVGEFVVAIGSPFGFQHTITFGIVSGKKRHLLRSGVVGGFIQTDASINTGNSGGPLVNMRGEVIGVNTATVGRGELGFAIPIDAVKAVIPQLYHDGVPRRGWLGVQIRPLETDGADGLGLERSIGVYVHDVLNDQPAQLAGIQVGDVIVRFDGKTISSPFDLQSAVSATPTGKIVQVKLLRKKVLHTVELTLGTMPLPK